jgi:hypothetical protein
MLGAHHFAPREMALLMRGHDAVVDPAGRLCTSDLSVKQRRARARARLQCGARGWSGAGAGARSTSRRSVVRRASVPHRLRHA